MNGFNSKLVRLKVIVGIRVQARIANCFNSKLVRLKVYPPLVRQMVPLKFQFQTGAIKSLDQKLADEDAQLRFNSKLVRLKVAPIDIDIASLRRFNSKLVRLKVTRARTI